MGNPVVGITDEIIANSVERDSGHCMIADGIRESIPGAQRISVDLQTIRYSVPKKGKRYVYLTPRAGQVALVNFDQGIKPEPFTMTLQKPQIIDMPKPKPKRDPVETPKGIRSDAVIEDQRPEPKKGPGRPKGTKNENVAELKKGHASNTLRRTGGQAPPTAALATTKGRRREFGLKSLTR